MPKICCTTTKDYCLLVHNSPCSDGKIFKIKMLSWTKSKGMDACFGSNATAPSFHNLWLHSFHGPLQMRTSSFFLLLIQQFGKGNLTFPFFFYSAVFPLDSLSIGLIAVWQQCQKHFLSCQCHLFFCFFITIDPKRSL